MYELKPITKRDGLGLGKSVIAVQSKNGEPYKLWNLYKNGDRFILATCDDVLRLPTNWEIIEEIQIDAIDFSIVFDGEWLSKDGKWRFESEDTPYIFWVNPAGELKVRKYGAETIIDIASGVSTISTLRAWKNKIMPELDQGMIVSYVKEGKLYYRAYCIQPDSTVSWETEREVTYLPGSIRNASLFLLNDYRCGFAIEDTYGKIHWLITHRNWAGMAILPENISAEIKPFIAVTTIDYHDTFAIENVAAVITPYIKMGRPISPVFVSASNTDEFTIVIQISHAIEQANLSAILKIKDENNRTFEIESGAISGDTITLTVTPTINMSVGNMTVSYKGDERLYAYNDELPFEVGGLSMTFTPEKEPVLAFSSENISVAVTEINIAVTRVTYKNVYGDENVSVAVLPLITVTQVGSNPL